MSSKDFGGYKRIVQYFWDPEPRNDDPFNSAIWCLGRCYNPGLVADPQPSDSDRQVKEGSDSSPATQRTAASQTGTSEAGSADDTTKTFGISNGVSEEDRGWSPEFLDDFESRVGEEACDNARKKSYLLSLPTTRMLLSRYIDSSFTVHQRAINTLVNGLDRLRLRDAFNRALVKDYEALSLKVYINGDGADVYEDRLLSLATAEGGQFTPTLILVGIRLGIDRVTPVYWEALKASLQLPQSVGIAGGRPSSSHYFVGFQGDNFFFLDPHQTRAALPLRSDVMEYTREDIDSCHTRRLRRLLIQDMDPSMLIGFLIRDREDWHKWRKSVTEVQGKSVIHVADKEPLMNGQGPEHHSAVEDVETFDEDENDGELVEYPVS
ncbi:MAG: hypothetical protein Q9201_000165 [Fulgogasparrea decipioides]